MTMTDTTGPGDSKAPAHDKKMARRFLAGFDPGSTGFTFQFLRDCGGRRAEISNGTLDEVWPKVLVFERTVRPRGRVVTEVRVERSS